jgi:hypothetical protein
VFTEKLHGNHCLTIEQIIEEHNRFIEFKAKYPQPQESKVMKTLNNRKRIVEEVAFIMNGPPKKTQAEAIAELYGVKVSRKSGQMEGWKSINQLFRYCQEKRKEREEDGRKEMAATEAGHNKSVSQSVVI